MAQILNTESSTFFNKNIEIYNKNKFSQWARYLNTTPIFVTYYSQCDIESRADAGYGSVQDELGPMSPLRFNKINNFPIYNLPELKPQYEVDTEEGNNINLDLNGLVILPNTLRPKPCDYMIITLPGYPPVLVRVNDIEYNTIQSNDAFIVNCDLKLIGDNVENKIKHLIVGTYNCIFENIGTDENVFIASDDLDAMNAISALIDELKSLYKNIYYNPLINSFVGYLHYPRDIPPTGIRNRRSPYWWDPYNYYYWGRPISHEKPHGEYLLYDIYLVRFINESGIYQDDENFNSIIMTYDDFVPANFDIMWKQTVWSAILTNDLTFLNEQIYCLIKDVDDRFGPIAMHHLKARGTQLNIVNGTLPDGYNENPEYPLKDYFSKNLMYVLGLIKKNGCDCECRWEAIFEDLTYFERVVCEWFLGMKEAITDYVQIEKEILNRSIENWRMIPIVIYFLIQIRKEYSTKQVTLEGGIINA